MPISAAASASPTTPTCPIRRARRPMARWSRRIAGGWDVAADLRARAADRRQCRHAAQPRDPGETGHPRPFLIVDAAMNDLMRPALYDAWHEIDAVAPRGERDDRQRRRPGLRDRRHLRDRRARWTGSTPAIWSLFRTAGAYAAAMSSTYNSRPLTAEVMVDGERVGRGPPAPGDRGSDRRRPAAALAGLIGVDFWPSWCCRSARSSPSSRVLGAAIAKVLSTPPLAMGFSSSPPP